MSKLKLDIGFFIFSSEKDFDMHAKALIEECKEDPNKELRTSKPQSYPCTATIKYGKVPPMSYFYFDYTYTSDVADYFKNLK